MNWGLVLVCLLNYGGCSPSETNLRKSLFSGYNKYIRPVVPANKTINVEIGMAVQNIESFNQIEETIKLNVWLRKYWKNDFLKWNSTNSLSQITLNNDEIWTPDIELLNAATKPDIYTLKVGMYLYSDGNMLWSMPAIYKFSCPLDLHKFPFDIQDCKMRFGSWSYDNTMMSIKPYGEDSTQIDVLDSFSHSEWNLDDYYVKNIEETRLCCGDKVFDINEYHFKLRRYTHYYKLNMGMTIALVIVSFIIMLIKPDNLSRTGTAVFIPLTILALQLTIADKIPIVGYYTLMDQFFLTCFIASMAVSIESGIVFALITSKTHIIYIIFDTFVNYDSLLVRLRNNIIRQSDLQTKNENFIQNKKIALFPTISNTPSKNNNSNEFDTIGNILLDSRDNSELTKRSSSYKESIVTFNKSHPDTTNISMEIIPKSDTINDTFIKNNTVVDTDITKTIEFDSPIIGLTYKEYILFNEVTRICTKVDNIFRVILPIIYFTIIIIIFSNE